MRARLEGDAPKRRRPRKVVAAEFQQAINDADTLAAIAERFKSAHPAKWEAIRLCATQHGVDEMIECLK